jgi:hypothetical protein
VDLLVKPRADFVLAANLAVPPIELWCVTHRDVQYNNRIRAVMNFMCEWFAQ